MTRPTKSEKVTRTENRNRSTGRYSYTGNFDRLCKCGHRLGIHAGEPPHDCFNEDKAGGGTGEPCDCKEFRPEAGRAALSRKDKA